MIKKKESFYQFLCVLLLVVSSSIFIIMAVGRYSNPQGESGSYLMSEVSLENRFSLIITQQDYQQAVRDFPEHAKNLDSYFNSERLPRDRFGNKQAWYFGTYSLLCIPIKILLKTIGGISLSHAFALTNAFALIVLNCVVLFRLKQSYFNKLLLLFLLICNPIISYIPWPSSECIIFVFIALGMLFWLNKEYCKSGVFISLAGTLNPVIMFLGIGVIFDYLSNIYFSSTKQLSINSFIDKTKKNFKGIVLFGSTFLIGIYPLVRNVYYFGSVNLQSSGGYLSAEHVGQRFVSYIFDLNFGIIPYFLITYLLFVVMSIYFLVKKRDKFTFFCNLAFYGILLLCSLMININCGMTGITRYNAWLFVIAIFYIIAHKDDLFTKVKQKRYVNMVIGLSIIFTGTVVYINKGSAVQMLPTAKIVLNNVPQLYNPFPYTFLTRVEGRHINADKNSFDLPSYYVDNSKMIRKILLRPENAPLIWEQVEGSENDLNELEVLLSKMDTDKKFQYINIPGKMNLKVKDNGENK